MRRLWQTDYEFPHTVYFNRASLQMWLKRHGFAVVDTCYLPEVPIRYGYRSADPRRRYQTRPGICACPRRGRD